MEKRKKVIITTSVAAIIAAAVFLVIMVVIIKGINIATIGQEEAVSYPMKSLSNICAYEGKVYCGTGGFYGEPIVQKSNIFAISDNKVYYVEKIQEAYESLTDELLPIWCSNLDGSNAKVIAEDDFLAGAGHERLIGDKLFYGYQYNEDYNMQYAYIDLNTGEREEVKTENRIDNILGYDGTYLYYNGYDGKTESNILGRIDLKKGKEKVLASYAQTDEEGYIDNVQFKDGDFYCFTLKEKSESYDYRDYEYEIQIRDGKTGKVTDTLPYCFTGSANYSMLVQEKEVYVARADAIVSVPINGKEGENTTDSENLSDSQMKEIVHMKEDEYWGILYFIPGDGYLYYEAIAEVDEVTGMNDYFYRVPLEGEAAELLAAWYTA